MTSSDIVLVTSDSYRFRYIHHFDKVRFPTNLLINFLYFLFMQDVFLLNGYSMIDILYLE